MIIDFHSHCFIPDSVAHRAIAAMAAGVKDIISPVGDGTLSNLLDHMDAHGIDMAAMLPIATKPQHYAVILKNALAIRAGELGERAQRKIVPFMSLHPFDPDAAKHLDEIASLGFKGIKLHPYYQNFSLADPALFKFFARIADLGLIVVSHAGFDIGYPDRFDACGPDEIITLLERVPGLTFVAAHLGGSLGFAPHATDRLIELGCYTDTAIFTKDQNLDEQKRLMRTWPAGKILFGTDFPWLAYPDAIAWVESTRPAAEREAVFSGNAGKLLALA